MQRRNMSGVGLGADGLGDALIDEAEQFDFDVVGGEFERELLRALTSKRRKMRSAAPLPAFSISSRLGTPKTSVARRSKARIC